MKWLHGLWARVRLLRRGAAEERMEEEIRSHIEMETEKNLAEGMPPAEARRRAVLAFGGVEGHKEAMRDGRTLAWAGGLSLDLRLGLRMMRKHLGFTLIGGLGMAVASGIASGIVAFSSTMMDPSLPLDEGDRIFAIETWDADRNGWGRQALSDYARWREELRTMRDLTAFREVRRNLIGAESVPEPVTIAAMSAAGFRLARVAPLLGRPPVDSDERDGAPPVVVIGYDEWQERFSGDPGIVGRELRLGNTVHIVVGVMPEGFAFPVNHRYWIPLPAEPGRLQPGEGPEVVIFGRLSQGVTPSEAQSELATVGQRTAADLPHSHGHLRPRLEKFTYSLLDIQGAAAWHVWLIRLAVSFLLIVVAANVAVLVYARTMMRRGEITVRTALGASRSRVVVQLFLEALVLATCSSLVGLVGVWMALNYAFTSMEREMGGRPFWIQPGFSAATLLYVVGLTVLAGVIVGVFPALKATGSRLEATLRQLGGGTGLQLGKTWTMLIVIQVATAAAGMPVAFSLAREAVSLGATRPTFAAEEITIAHLRTDTESPDSEGRSDVGSTFEGRFGDRFAEILRRLGMEPGVAAVTYASVRPGRESSARVEVVDGAPVAGARSGHAVASNEVAPDFFETLGASILTGRGFQSGDIGDEATPVIVNASLARRVMGGDALGHRLRYLRTPSRMEPGSVDTLRTYEIVGVVADLHSNAVDPSLVPAVIYHPAGPDPVGAGILLRTRGIAPASISGRLREITAEVDPSLRYESIQPFDEVDRHQRTSARLAALLIAAVAASVVLLSAAGIYALISCVVTQRRREIGIRAALGARPRQIIAGVLARACGQLGLGLGVGLGAALLMDTLTDGMLLDGKGNVLLPLFAATMLGVGLLATLGPAQRSLRIQPMEALREE